MDGSPINTKATSRVTVGLLAHNAEQWITETLDSVRAQSFGDFQVVIADDASTDGTFSICKQYVERDRRFTLIRHHENIGGAKNFNSVLSAAHGTYFVWLSDHDRWLPGFLERCVRELDRNPGAVLCWVDVRVVDHGGRVLREYSNKIDTRTLDVQTRINLMTWGVAQRTECIYGVIRMSTLRRLRNFPSVYRQLMGPDVILLLELVLIGDIIHVDELLFELREASDFDDPEVYLRKLRIEPRSEIHGALLFLQFIAVLTQATWRNIATCRDKAVASMQVAKFAIRHHHWMLTVLVRSGRRNRRQRRDQAVSS